MVAASLIAYLCGEFVNSYTLAKMKILTRGRHLWTRTVGSTVTGQFVDSIVFMLVAFLGKESLATIFTLIWSGYLFKVVYEVVATPLTYWIVNSLKRLEGVNVFDWTRTSARSRRAARERRLFHRRRFHESGVGTGRGLKPL